MKKFLLILLTVGLVILLFVGCFGVPDGAEGEGEGEGEEEVSRVVVVELFSQDGCSSCAVVEPIIEQLAEEYERSEVVFLEERAYGPYSLDEIRDRYNWYIPDVGDNRGTPNILFDGLNLNLIHGASSYSTINSKISTELGKEAKIKITATRNSNSDTTTITGTIENISTSDLSNLIINGMNFKDRGEVGTKYSVMDIFVNNPTEITVSTLAANEKTDFSFVLGNINWDGNNMHGVIFVQAPNSSKKEILQAMYVE